MFELFRQDAARWIVPGAVTDPTRVTLGVALKLLYRYPPLRAMLWFRFGSWCKHKGIRFLPGFAQRRIMARYGLEIVVGSSIGGGLYVAHPIGTVIAVNRMGSNCSVIAAVTFGLRNTWEFPTVGDNVFVGAGARILGGIRVGDNAVVGANAVVIHDVPPCTTVVGIPARPLVKAQGPERIGREDASGLL